jgi:hypothetical protein
MERKFEEARDLDYSAQKDVMQEYGARSIEEALVIKNWGRGRIEYVCNRCGCIISEKEAEENEEHDAFSGWIHYCRSCKKIIDSDLQRYRSRDRDRFEKL